ncbi:MULTISPECIES: nodulation protein NodU [Bradyrhizobium]|uniref:Nodulation protein NodU n=3 Tax=Bradyrhizobium TaxID=374 RepID=A0AAE5X892_9BRAD|nr:MULTISPECIES: nodulation protein NodU [Bradyrhizobium]MCG2631962.1 nodulation protein NodU [Bradyrhizobium zhengyangense]MCG2645017.1 nodulation protein NodU [Bradyrhizobium zhengyangense]MCG2672755.1 nodulation protein NodU [Bradyrhizobium zhengyangense]MDN4985394.1 nodulation protein NodU [Bradyrhizobium sp. WYCCWR 13022]MDN5002375.1 nodulation protein NodU [Bradyrhizobium sp. WYCCWR 12677]
MRICGIKLTHDGGIALVEDGRLIFCIEQEKRSNNPRYQTIDNLDAIVVALTEHGLDPQEVDQFVIDGWAGVAESQFQVLSGTTPITLKGAPYVERHADGLLTSCDGSGLRLDGSDFPYRSYPHVTGHVASAYCTSPFAKAGQPAFCLVWDGGTFPRLYHVEHRGAQFIECLFPVIGHVYAAAGLHFGPYKQANRANWDLGGPGKVDPGGAGKLNLGVAGKLMAYIALGSVIENIVTVFEELYQERFAADTKLASFRTDIESMESALAAVHDFFDASARHLKARAPEDVLASFHCFLERLLVRKMALALQRHSYLGARNLCVAGGCGLNIKWNSALRATGLFDAVWVPPFPNDSGSAIGAACCAMVVEKGFSPLEWSVYSGPALQRRDVPPEWKAAPCSLHELATILAGNKPVIFLTGRAELGPRALGSRSILAPATSPRMKDYLNDIKLREHFRPVAPICLEDRAPDIFSPGTPDPYMLFDHQTRPEWRDKIPAVVHLDGSARLQTICRTSQHKVAELLVEYEKLTGIPLLCNTSANHHGRGFFPHVAAACEWGRVEHVWGDGILWTKAR